MLSTVKEIFFASIMKDIFGRPAGVLTPVWPNQFFICVSSSI